MEGSKDEPDVEEQFELHKAVFDNDLKKLNQIIKSNKDVIDKKDKHGNTALHLATMLGKKDCICLLLAASATVNVKNSLGFDSLAEAISRGDRAIIELILRKLKEQTRESIKKRRPALNLALNQMADFYLEIKWEFSSWVPLLSKILPNDICKIYKSGSKIRLDSTLIDFNEMRWQRGDITFIFCSESDQMITAMDNEAKCYQTVRTQENEMEIEDEIDLLMMSDIVNAKLNTKNISFSPAKTGWFIREDKKEKISQYNCDVYHVNGLTVLQRKRREHLNREDLQKNKTSIVESLTKSPVEIDPTVEIPRRASLKPPSNKNVTWEEYMNADEVPTLGRDLVFKKSQKTLKATIAMSQDFPLSIDILLNVLEIIAPFKHFAKLRDFVSLKLPKGFPIKIDIPLIPSVSAKVTFQDFEFRDNIQPSLFEIPSDYVEDENRFPDL